MRGRPSRLAHRALDVSIGLARPPAEPLAAALAVARTQTGPTGQMLGVDERAQVHADFSDDGPGRFAVHSRNRQETLDRFLEHRHAPLDLLLHGACLCLEPLDLAQLLR